jgi:hypothetical protein
MRSRSVSARYITLAASPFSSSFVSYLKRLLPSQTGGKSPSKSPQPFKLYTKAAPKANPPGVLADPPVV